MDESILVTVIGTGVAVAGFMYTCFRDFKESINENIDNKVNKLDGDIKALAANLDAD